MEASFVLAPAPVGRATDVELVAAARAGDQNAFGELYARYRQPVQAFVLRMVGDMSRSEDVTHDVFVSALRRLRANDHDINFRPWVYEIARNACIDLHRRGSRARTVSFDADEPLAPCDARRLVCPDAGPEEAAERRQRLDDLCGAFGGLSESEHQVLVLRELEGLSYREIGDNLGLTRPAVESTLFRARRRLADEYQDLSSGHRCVRVQASIVAAAEGTAIGKRERRRVDAHVTRCRPCRSHARRLGIELAPTPPAGRLGALLPMPFGFSQLKAALGGSAGAAPVAPVTAAGTSTLGAAIAKIAVVAASLAVVGAGGEVALHAGSLRAWLPGLAAEQPIQSATDDGLGAGDHGHGFTAGPASRALGLSGRTGANPGGGVQATGGAASAPIVSGRSTVVQGGHGTAGAMTPASAGPAGGGRTGPAKGDVAGPSALVVGAPSVLDAKAPGTKAPNTAVDDPGTRVAAVKAPSVNAPSVEAPSVNAPKAPSAPKLPPAADVRGPDPPVGAASSVVDRLPALKG